MKLSIECTDCRHERVFSGVNTAGLARGELIFETHSCQCLHKCENCEDLEILRKEVKELESKLVECKAKAERMLDELRDL